MRPDASISICVTAPEIEPVSLSEAKAHLRVDGTDNDAQISSYLTAARERIEHECRRAFIRQQWQASIAGLAAGGQPVELPRPRIESAAFALEYRDEAGDWNAHTDYRLLTAREPAWLWLSGSATTDAAVDCNDAVWRATYWTGYGADAVNVPGPIRHAIMLLTAHLYERREPAISGATISEVPKSIDWLLDAYRVPWQGGFK